MHYLDFERPIAELEGKIVELRKLAEDDPNMDIDGDVGRLESRAEQLVRDAYPGVSAEERGQAEAIARSIQAGLNVRTPFIATVIGEGMSGGAIAIASANRVYMLEHAIYSVISPEGAASILWRDPARAQDAATAMKITAADLVGLKVIDGVVEEPL